MVIHPEAMPTHLGLDAYFPIDGFLVELINELFDQALEKLDSPNRRNASLVINRLLLKSVVRVVNYA